MRALTGLLLFWLLWQPAFAGGSLRLTSPAFRSGAMIPPLYTCQGRNVSPPLSWSGAPPKTASFALFVEDPDAPQKTFTHWVVYDIPGTATKLDQPAQPLPLMPDGSKHAFNDVGMLGYHGPCPPKGTHRYFFRLYALDRKLGPAGGMTKEQVRKEMAGHVLAEATLMGRFTKGH